MKKLARLYKPYMLRLIVYKLLYRGVVTAILCLAWQRFISDGIYTLWEAPALLAAVVLLAWAWACYLRLDGVGANHLKKAASQQGRPGKKRHPSRSMMDFVDEKVISFDELEPEQQTFCSMAANLVLGLALLAAGVAASIW